MTCVLSYVFGSFSLSRLHNSINPALLSCDTMSTTGHALFNVPSWVQEGRDPTNEEWLRAADQAASAQRYIKCTLGGMQQQPLWVQAVLSIPPTKIRLGSDGQWEAVAALPLAEEILKEIAWRGDRNASIGQKCEHSEPVTLDKIEKPAKPIWYRYAISADPLQFLWWTEDGRVVKEQCAAPWEKFHVPETLRPYWALSVADSWESTPWFYES
jgi:hypothetical protein